jgi:hypothetical protein
MNNPTIDDNDTDLALNGAEAITGPTITAAETITNPPADTPSAIVTEDIWGNPVTPEVTGPALAIASTLPKPPASHPVVADGTDDAIITDEVAETLAAVKAIDSEVSEIIVATVQEKDTAITPDTPEKAKKRQVRRDLFTEQLRKAGLGDEVIASLVIQREILHGRQRVHPTWRTVCSPEMIAFWATRMKADGTVQPRSYEDIEADMIKLIRNDGGQVGPEARYLQLNTDAANHAAAAVAINEHVTQRIKSIRTYVCSAINELRRRRAAAGTNLTTIPFLAVK